IPLCNLYCSEMACWIQCSGLEGQAFRLWTQDSRLQTPDGLLDSMLGTRGSSLQTLDSRLKTLDSRLQTPDSRLQTQEAGGRHEWAHPPETSPVMPVPLQDRRNYWIGLESR